MQKKYTQLHILQLLATLKSTFNIAIYKFQLLKASTLHNWTERQHKSMYNTYSPAATDIVTRNKTNKQNKMYHHINV